MHKELSALDVKRLAPPETGKRYVPVGGVKGLYLQLTATGARSWILRATVAGKRREMGLGPYPDVSLAAARERAREARDSIWRGSDPVEERKAARAALEAARRRSITFDAASERYLADRGAEFRNSKHRDQWTATLTAYASPEIGKMMVADITTRDVLRCLKPIWADKTETAKRTRQRIEAVLSWATVAGYRVGDNPARWAGNLKELLPSPERIAKSTNQPAVPLDLVAEWFADLRSREGTATRALEFAALTAARSGEVRGALWSEIDMGAQVWTIRCERTKTRKEHRVPLSPEAVALLEQMPRDGVLVFPAVKGGMLSDMSLSAAMKRIHEARETRDLAAEVPAQKAGYRDARNGRPAVPHGLRSTFRDWCAERTEFPRDMAEIAVGHVVGSDVERAYRRGDMVEKRRAMMIAWARFLTVANSDVVVPMKKKALTGEKH